jgi:hypothetical protein
VVATGTASAYPQFQLSRDQTCTGCHISPAGGSLLNENGMNTAEAISQFGTSADPFYGKVKLPTWLTLGGDARGAIGYFRTGADPTNTTSSLATPTGAVVPFPMQFDIYANAQFGPISVRVTGGIRPAQWVGVGNTPAFQDRFWSREHYITYQTKPGENEGLYIRVGRFMPVFGLRFVEHVDYTRQYGGVPLYGETYAAAVEYVTSKYEAHLTGFIEDPLIDTVVHDNGGAFYGEYRLDEHTAVGLEAMLSDNTEDTKYRGGLTAKRDIAGPDILLQAEGQVVTERVKNNQDRGAPNQLVGYLMASKFIGQAIMVDLGLGHFDENIRIAGLDRDAVDLNIHWFATSHIEVLVMNRLSKVGLFQSPSGVVGGWSMLQLHYRI